MKELSEKGFVFIDDKNTPYWVRKWGNGAWIFYWHDGQKSWVSYRQINQSEVWEFNSRSIADDQAEIYHAQHKKSFPNV